MKLRGLHVACACLALTGTGLAPAEARGGLGIPEVATADTVAAISSTPRSADTPPIFALAALALLALASGRPRPPKN